MKVAQKIKHAKICMQKFIQNPFPPLNPPINQTHKPRKIIKSTWNKQTQKFKINTAATWNHQTQSNLIRPSFHSHPLLFFLSRPFPKIKSLYLSLSLQTQSLFLFLSLSLSLSGETQIPNRFANAASEQQIDDDEHQARKNRRRLRRIVDVVEQSLGR